MIHWNEQIGVELQATFGDDKFVAESAWTSSLDHELKKKRKPEDIHRVVNMLADSRHSVPFESVIFRFWMKIPIAIDRQVEKHRISSQNGMSGRYRTMPNEFLDMPEDVQSILNKLSANEIIDPYYEYIDICDHANVVYATTVKMLKKAEKDNLITNKELKRAREFYRGILPQHNMTEKIMTINLRSWCNFIKLRNSEHAQKEIQTVAKLMLTAVKTDNICPIALEALERNNWNI